jgi:hypothetical protein
MDTKPRKLGFYFWLRGLGCAGRNFNYNTESAICQEENRKKIKNIFLPKLLTKLQECAIIHSESEVIKMIWLAILLFIIGFCIIAYNVEQVQSVWLGTLGYIICMVAAALASSINC